MAKTTTDTDAQAVDQAVDALLTGLGLKRKQELIERNDRLRFQFLQTQKIAAGKAREGQINTFLASVVTGDKKVRELVFSAWLKDNNTSLGEVPDFPTRFKRDADEPDPNEDEAIVETDVKDATAALKKWLKTSEYEYVNAFARLGPYEFPAKVLTVVKSPKPKAGTVPLEGGEAAVAATASDAAAVGVSDAVVAELRRQLEEQKTALEAKAARAEEETSKFKRLLEENKDKRKAELSETSDKARAELQAKQTEWQRVEANLRKEIADLNKARLDATDKTTKARDELLPLRQQIERLERDAKRAEKEAERATGQSTEARTETTRLEEENTRLTERVKVLETAQALLIAKEKQLERMKTKGASIAITATENLKIWEEALAEQEVKEAFRRTFNLDTIRVNHYEHDEKDLQDIWKELIANEQDIVTRFFALPFDELTTPTEEFRELVTNFIELKDTLVAREQLSHLINFVANRFLSTLKQKV